MESFRERAANNDGSYFLLMFDGTPIELSEDEHSEVDRRLRIFMENRDVHSDMIKNVSYIRTIFIDYDEHYLYMKYHDREKDEFVEYKNKELTLYDIKEQEKKDKKNKKGKTSKTTYQRRQDIYNELKNIGPVGVGPNEYKLIDCYNYFYNTHPNFSNKQVNILFQCMVQILNKFNIELFDYNDFVYNDELGIKTSESLERSVSNLFPYGMIRGINGKEISELDQEKIRVIGSTINDSVQGINRYQGIVGITKLLCPTEKEQESIDQINEMNENFHNLELVKKIESRMQERD